MRLDLDELKRFLEQFTPAPTAISGRLCQFDSFGNHWSDTEWTLSTIGGYDKHDTLLIALCKFIAQGQQKMESDSK